MPRLKNAIPRPHFHKPTGKARVRVNGKDIYLGLWGSPEADEAYRRFVAEFLIGGPAKADRLTVKGLAERYLTHAKTKYQPNTAAKVAAVLDLATSIYGSVAAAEFGPAKLRAIQGQLAAAGLSPSTINQRITMIRKAFKWAVSWELVPGSVAHALREVEGVKAPTPEPRPVADIDVDAAIPFMPENIKTMVQVQRLTGMRPGEICGLTRAEIHQDKPTAGIWMYSPADHKNAHHGHRRDILIGPQAQAILLPWLAAREFTEPVFRPCDSLPWAPKRAKNAHNAKRQISDQYSVCAYAKAVNRACKLAGIEPWSPNQLRHSAASRIASEFSREVAQTVLGHKTLLMTARYVQADMEKAAEAMKKAG